jgi:hypothetical protein
MGVWSLLSSSNGGVPLALKKGSSGNLGLPELIDIVKAFEAQNSVELVISGQIVDGRLSTDLRWTATAYDGDPDAPGVKILALANVRCMEKRLVSLEAVLLQLLYALDFQLAENEFRSAIEHKA